MDRSPARLWAPFQWYLPSPAWRKAHLSLPPGERARWERDLVAEHLRSPRDATRRRVLSLCLRGVVPGVLRGSRSWSRETHDRELLTCVDDALLRCFARLATWEPRDTGGLAGWCFRIAANLTRSRLRERAGVVNVRVVPLEDLVGTVASGAERPEFETLMREVRERAVEIAMRTVRRAERACPDVRSALAEEVRAIEGDRSEQRLSAYRRARALASLRDELTRLHLRPEALREVTVRMADLFSPVSENKMLDRRAQLKS